MDLSVINLVPTSSCLNIFNNVSSFKPLATHVDAPEFKDIFAASNFVFIPPLPNTPEELFNC